MINKIRAYRRVMIKLTPEQHLRFRQLLLERGETMQEHLEAYVRKLVLGK